MASVRIGSAWLIIGIWCWPLGTVAAGVFVGPQNEETRSTHHRAIVSHDDGVTTLLESVEVRNEATRFAWLKPFPAKPDIVVKPRLSLSDLERATDVKAPMNHTVRRDLFGPSIVTFLIDKLVREPKRPRTQAQAPSAAPRTLSILDYEVFDGTIQTSTISGRLMVPAAMQTWFKVRRLPISEATKSAIAGHLNRGWVLVALEVEDRSADLSEVVQLPAVQFRFPSAQPMLPLLRQSKPLPAEPQFDIWTLAAQPLVSSAYPTHWEYRPWTLKAPVDGRFTSVFSRAIDARDPLTDILARQVGLRLPPTPHLVRHRFRHGSEVWQEFDFMPAIEPGFIPGLGRRGGLLDGFLCLLLGLTPLLFTPESWFLRWWTSRIAQKARRPTRWGNVWALYAFAVAIYWLVTLTGVGRLAAIAPAAVGLAQLLWPTEPYRDEFVRVEFKKKAQKSG